MTSDETPLEPEQQQPRSNDPSWSQAARLGRLAPVVLVVLAALVFVPGLFGEFVWDDLALIRGNAYVRDLSRLPEALTNDFWHVSTLDPGAEGHNLYYRPVVTLAYALQFRAFGESPFGYHAVNLVLHLACVLLAFAWLRRRAGPDRAAVAAVLLGAALFAVHASRPESVSWVSGSTDLWMTALVLLGLQLWDRVASRVSTAGAVACFALAVLAKETALVVPFVLLADAWLLQEAGAQRARAVRRALLPLLGVGVVFGIRLVLVPLRGAGVTGVPDAVQRVLATAGHYVRSIVWPWPPSVEWSYLRLDARGGLVHPPWSLVLGALVAAALVVLVVVAWRRRAARPWLADAAWLVLPLLPALNLWPLGLSALASARNLYLPLLGAAALVVRGLGVAEGRSPGVRRAVFAIGGLAMAAWSLLSLYQISTLRDEDTLWTYEHAVAPDNPFAAERLARVRFQQGRHVEALAAVESAWVDSRGAEERRGRLALLAAEITLASTSDAEQAALLRLRDFYDALARGETGRVIVGDLTIELQPDARVHERLTTRYQEFLVPRAIVYARTLDLPAARRQLEIVVRKFPQSVDGWVQLALVLAREERWDDARRAAQQGLVVKPDDERLPTILRHLDTASHLAETLGRADPTTQAMTRAETLLAFGGIEQARRVLQPVLESHPDSPPPVLLRILIDAADARFDLARQVVVEARQRMPGEAALWDEALRRLADEERAWQSSIRGGR